MTIITEVVFDMTPRTGSKAKDPLSRLEARRASLDAELARMYQRLQENAIHKNTADYRKLEAEVKRLEDESVKLDGHVSEQMNVADAQESSEFAQAQEASVRRDFEACEAAAKDLRYREWRKQNGYPEHEMTRTTLSAKQRRAAVAPGRKGKKLWTKTARKELNAQYKARENQRIAETNTPITNQNGVPLRFR
ncbi:hypothetical protein ACO2I3_01085 [Leptospira interrogans]